MGSPAQKAVLIVGAIALAMLAVIFPMGVAIGITAFFAIVYTFVSVYKFRLTLNALGTHLETDVTDEEIAALDERTLPIHTEYLRSGGAMILIFMVAGARAV